MEVEGESEAAAAEIISIEAEAAVVPDEVLFLPQYLLCRCRDLVWQAGVFQEQRSDQHQQYQPTQRKLVKPSDCTWENIRECTGA